MEAPPFPTGAHTESRAWYAVRTKPNCERIAQMHFSRQGLISYLPVTATIRAHARRREEVKRPFLPGYLFLQLAPRERNWTAISSTRGAIGPVRFGAVYPAVPDVIIASIRDREDASGQISLPPPAFQQGQKVRVTGQGPMQDLEALFWESKGADRALILLDLLSGIAKATVPVWALQAA